MRTGIGFVHQAQRCRFRQHSVHDWVQDCLADRLMEVVMQRLATVCVVLAASLWSATCRSQDLYSQLPPSRPGYAWICLDDIESSVHQSTYQAYQTVPVRSAQSVDNSTQGYAQAEANRLAAGGQRYYRAHGGHPGGNMPGARFTGTGYSSSPSNVGTCEPKTRMTLIADAMQRGIDGMYYRVRAWR